MPRFYLPQDNIHGKLGQIDGQELEHLRRVLRLGKGDRITVFDDWGWEHEAVICRISALKAEIEILESRQTQRESSLKIILAVGLTKGEKMDFVVEKATELGVRTLLPFVSSYTVPRLDDAKLASRLARWRKIALSAAKQSGRGKIPEIMELRDYHRLTIQTWPETLKLLFWEGETEQTLLQVHATAADVRSVLLIIGPEGGFSRAEAEEAQTQGFKTVKLGPRLLRAETAAIAATSLVQFLWGDWR
jgi:16S rRNA (uracil1498-N3)-methyltransferase